MGEHLTDWVFEHAFECRHGPIHVMIHASDHMLRTTVFRPIHSLDLFFIAECNDYTVIGNKSSAQGPS
jgi:hypothetical protein